VKFVSQFQVQSAAALAPPPQPQVPKQIFLNANKPAPEPEPEPESVKRELPKIGRNDPCPCGSGKKYKSCHMKNDDGEAEAS